MDLSKLIWLLQNRALFFCRSDRLGDPYEGYYPAPVAQGVDHFVQMMMSGIDREKKTSDALSEQEETFRQTFKGILKFWRGMRNQLFLTCWHANELESAAMWKLYTSHADSICIRSTYQTLASLLPSECFLGKVRYIDYRVDSIDIQNALNFIVHKRKSFEHEHEIRGVIWKAPGQEEHFPFHEVPEGGAIVPIDTTALIQEIFVSPDSSPILRQVVEGLARTYNVVAPIRQSEVNAPPSY
jgi:hypothetical protein